MTNTPIRTLLVTSVLALPLVAVAEGSSPWLPIPGQLSLTLYQTEQSGNSAYIGTANVPGIPQGSSQRPAYNNMFDNDFKVPRTWKSDQIGGPSTRMSNGSCARR